MSSNNNKNNDNDNRKPPPAEARPDFRFASLETVPTTASMSTSRTTDAYAATVSTSAAKDNNVNVSNQQIDKRQYFEPSHMSEAPASTQAMPPQFWSPTSLPAVPAFYPLEKSSRLVPHVSGTEIAGRLCQVLKALSIQALYDNEAATAQLLTGEHVEMHLSLWVSNNSNTNSHAATAACSTNGVLVEVQRRKGDPILFYHYARQILDAATGAVPAMHSQARYSKKVQRLLSMHSNNHTSDSDGSSHGEPFEHAICALEIAHGLVLKDRMDARVLGLESLCLLTDPTKTGDITAILASHVVLLGSLQNIIQIPGGVVLPESHIYEEIRAAILGLVQFSKIGEDNDANQVDRDADAEHLTILHNLALAVLANALDVIEKEDTTVHEDDDFREEEEVEEDVKPRGRLRTASSNDVTNEFLKATEESSNSEILSTLIKELGQAGTKPHDACLSAKCLGTICRASDEARKRAKELGAKTVVATALDVGQKTHSKLETECAKVEQVLRLTDTTNNDDNA